MKRKFFLLITFCYLLLFSYPLVAIQEEQPIDIEKLEQEANLRQEELLSQRDQKCLVQLEKQRHSLPDIFLIGILLITATTSAYLVIKFLQTRTYLSKHKILSLFKDKFNEMTLTITSKDEEIDVLKMTIEKMKSISNEGSSDDISFNEEEYFNDNSSNDTVLDQSNSVENSELTEKISTLEKEKAALEKQSLHDIELIKNENLQIKKELDEAQTEKIEFLGMIESLQKQISTLEKSLGKSSKPIDEKEIATIVENSSSISQEDLNSLFDEKKPEKEKPFSGIIDQDFMNKLIAESEPNTPIPPKKERPLKQKPVNDIEKETTSEKDSLISQDDLDKMLSTESGTDSQKNNNEIESDSSTVSQDDLDKMFDNTPSTPVSQDDLDKMFDSDSPTVSQDDLDKMFDNTPSTPVSQNDLDKMFDNSSSKTTESAKPNPSTEHENKKPETTSSFSKEQLNDLLDESVTKSKESDQSKPVAMSQDDLDSLFNQPTTFDSPLDSFEKTPQKEIKEETLPDNLSQEDIEKLLGG